LTARVDSKQKSGGEEGLAMRNLKWGKRLQRVWNGWTRWKWRKTRERMKEVREARYRLLQEQIEKEPEERAKEEMRRRMVYLKAGMLPKRMQAKEVLDR